MIVVATICVGVGFTRHNMIGVYYTAEQHQKALAKYDHSLFHDGNSANPSKPSSAVELARKWIHPSAYARADTLYLSWHWPDLRHELSDLNRLYGLHEILGEIDSLTLSESQELATIPELRELCINITGNIEPGALAHLASCPNLKQFWLTAPETDLATYEAISRSRTLKDVMICDNKISPSKTRLVSQCRSIEKLTLDHSHVDAEILAPLRNLPLLRELHLSNSTVNESGMEILSQLPLTTLMIVGQAVEIESSIASLSHSRTLECLVVRTKCVQKEGELAAFANCHKLERLYLADYEATSADLRALSKSRTLQAAAFTGNILDAEIKAFTQSKPGRTLQLFPQTPSLKLSPDSPSNFSGNATAS